MDATTSSKMPNWSLEDIKDTLNKFKAPSGQREWGFDVFYCPIDIFEYIADITWLYKSQPDPKEIHQDAIKQAILLGHVIKIWDAPTDLGPRFHMVEVWRLGTLLYLIRLFRLSNEILDTASLSRSIFLHACAIPSKSSWSYSTSWPLFQAGMLLTREDHQTKIWLRNELYMNFCSLGCLHPKLAAEALEQFWLTGTDRLCDVFGSGVLQHRLIL